MGTAGGRIKDFDWLRGLAVLVMVETHSLVFVRPELHQTRAMARLNWVNGLVAPSFILAAGFSLGLLQTRAARAAIGVMHPGRADVIGGGALVLDRLMERFGFGEVLASEHDILDGMAWSLARNSRG